MLTKKVPPITIPVLLSQVIKLAQLENTKIPENVTDIKALPFMGIKQPPDDFQ